MHYNLKAKYYFINKFNTKNLDKLDKVTAVIYRNYSIEKTKITEILKIKKYCRNKNIKFFLSNNIKLAIHLNLDGAYIPSFNKDLNHLSYALKRNFKIIGSAHNINEMRNKEIQKVDKIFLSSLFKKNKNYLGINKFRLLSNLTSKKVVALGGITKQNLKKTKFLNISGFAAISYFEQKKAPKKGPF